MKKFLTEFKAFISKGNVMALAVGVIIGSAFTAITNSLVSDLLMPLLGMLTGGVDFSDLKLRLPNLWGTIDPETGAEAVNYLSYGSFLNAVLNFLILALAVFFLMKGFNRLMARLEKKDDAPAAPPEPSNEEKLLGEIRDLLKDRP